MEEETVKLAYSSYTNISFHGWLDTGILQEEWDGMSEDEQQKEFNNQLNELVEINVIPAGEDPDRASDPYRRH